MINRTSQHFHMGHVVRTVNHSGYQGNNFLHFCQLYSGFCVTRTATPRHTRPLSTRHKLPRRQRVLLLARGLTSRFLSSTGARHQTWYAHFRGVIFRANGHTIVVTNLTLLQLFFRYRQYRIRATSTYHAHPTFLTRRYLCNVHQTTTPLRRVIRTLARRTLRNDAFRVQVAIFILASHSVLTTKGAIA